MSAGARGVFGVLAGSAFVALAALIAGMPRSGRDEAEGPKDPREDDLQVVRNARTCGASRPSLPPMRARDGPEPPKAAREDLADLLTRRVGGRTGPVRGIDMRSAFDADPYETSGPAAHAALMRGRGTLPHASEERPGDTNPNHERSPRHPQPHPRAGGDGPKPHCGRRGLYLT